MFTSALLFNCVMYYLLSFFGWHQVLACTLAKERWIQLFQRCKWGITGFSILSIFSSFCMASENSVHWCLVEFLRKMNFSRPNDTRNVNHTLPEDTVYYWEYSLESKYFIGLNSSLMNSIYDFIVFNKF